MVHISGCNHIRFRNVLTEGKILTRKTLCLPAPCNGKGFTAKNDLVLQTPGLAVMYSDKNQNLQRKKRINQTMHFFISRM